MAEIPKVYMPDVKVQWGLGGGTGFKTEQVKYRGGRRQRRSQPWPSTGIRTWHLQNAHVMLQEDRRALYEFFRARKGAAEAFFFFEPSPRKLSNFVTGQTLGTSGGLDNWHAVAPYKAPFWLGDSPIPATYLTLGGASYMSLAGLASQIATTMSCPPRGNRYCSFLFNGVNQHASAGTAANTRISGDQSWAAWVFLRPLDNGMTFWPIMTNEAFQASGTLFGIDATRKIFIRTNQAGASTAGSCTTAIPLNSWHHVVASRSGTNVTFFIDGQQMNTAAGVNNPVTGAFATLIGGSGVGTYFHGMLNDCRIFNVAESLSNIQSLYADDQIFSLGAAAIGQQANWAITDGRTATAFTDTSGNAYTANLTNPSDDRWVGGEEEVAFTAGASGAMTVLQVLNARQRATVTFGMDDIPESFLADIVDVRASFDISIEEAV